MGTLLVDALPCMVTVTDIIHGSISIHGNVSMNMLPYKVMLPYSVTLQYMATINMYGINTTVDVLPYMDMLRCMF